MTNTCPPHSFGVLKNGMTYCDRCHVGRPILGCRGRPVPWTLEMDDALLDLRGKGWSIEAASDRVGVSPGTAAVRLLHLGAHRQRMNLGRIPGTRAAVMSALLLLPGFALAEGAAAPEGPWVPRPVAGDPRVVEADFVEGRPVSVLLRSGHTTQVGFPRGWSVMDQQASQQHIMDGTGSVPRRDAAPGRPRPDSDDGAPPGDPYGKDDAPVPLRRCSATETLAFCLAADRFVRITPVKPQMPQSYHLLLTRNPTAPAPDYVPVVLEIRTVDTPPPPQHPLLPQPSGEPRVARTGTAPTVAPAPPPPPPPIPDHHMSVTIRMPEAAAKAPPPPAPVARRAVARPPVQPAPAPVAAAPRGQPYEIRGDAGLLGMRQ